MKIYALLLALLSGGSLVGAADEVKTDTYDLFSSTEGSTLGGLRNAEESNLPSINTDNQTQSANVANWTRPYGTYTFGNALALTDSRESITFSFTLSGVVSNSVGTVALQGTSGTIPLSLVVGETHNGTDGASNADFCSGVAADNSSDAYLLHSDTGWGGNTWNITDVQNLGTLSGSAYFAGSIAWDETAGIFVAAISQLDGVGGDVIASNSYNLASTYELIGVSVALDGASGATPSVSNLQIIHASVPEPATTTLSLLALAGLAARRRRK